MILRSHCSTVNPRLIGRWRFQQPLLNYIKSLRESNAHPGSVMWHLCDVTTFFFIFCCSIIIPPIPLLEGSFTVQVGLELSTWPRTTLNSSVSFFPSPLPECSDCRQSPPHRVYILQRMETRVYHLSYFSRTPSLSIEQEAILASIS